MATSSERDGTGQRGPAPAPVSLVTDDDRAFVRAFRAASLCGELDDDELARVVSTIAPRRVGVRDVIG